MIYSNILNSLRLVHWVEPIDRLRHGVFSFAAAASLLSQVTFFCGTYFSFYQIKSTFFLQSFTQWEMECPITLMAHISKALLRGEAMDHFDEEIPFSLLTWSVLVARGPTKSLLDRHSRCRSHDPCFWSCLLSWKESHHPSFFSFSFFFLLRLFSYAPFFLCIFFCISLFTFFFYITYLATVETVSSIKKFLFRAQINNQKF